MRKMLYSTAAFTLAAMLSAPALAAPATPKVGAPTAGTSHVIPVAEGCGYGEHRGPRGGCVLNDSPGGVVRGLLGPGGPGPGPRRVCPVGFHLGPAGEACVPNGGGRVCPRGFHLGPAGERCLPN